MQDPHGLTWYFDTAALEAVDDAREVLGDQAAWHRTVQRLRHRHSNDGSAHELGEVHSVPKSAFAKLGAVGWSIWRGSAGAI